MKVEVAESRHLQGSRYGSGRHDEGVDIATLGAESNALVDAEPVLFVDDDQCKIVEVHAFGDERVRAHDQSGLAVAELFELPLSCVAPVPACQEKNVKARCPGEIRNRSPVLTREELGGRKERCLVASFRCSQHGVERHKRLPASHIALQKAKHAALGLHVGENFRTAKACDGVIGKESAFIIFAEVRRCRVWTVPDSPCEMF